MQMGKTEVSLSTLKSRSKNVPYLCLAVIIIHKMFLMKLITGKNKSCQSKTAALNKEVISYYSPENSS